MDLYYVGLESDASLLAVFFSEDAAAKFIEGLPNAAEGLYYIDALSL